MKKLVYLFVFLFVSLQSFAQQDDSLMVVRTNDGNFRIGKILSDDGREILLDTKEVGKIYIRKQDISSIEPYSAENIKVVNGEFRDSGPFTTRYFFTTNALPIKKKENYALLNLYGPEVHFALTDRFSLGVMSTWVGSPIGLAAKYSIPTQNERLNFSLGGIFGTSGYIGQFRGYGGLYWGTVTYGDRLTNFSFSAGFAHIHPGNIGGGGNSTYFEPGTYPAYEEPVGSGNFYHYYPQPITISNDNNFNITAPAIGASFITSVGKKASFIFDAMVFFGSANRRSSYVDQTVTYTYDSTTGQPEYTIVSDYENVNNSSQYRTTAAYLMPGMRFQKKEDRAFQFALAGVVAGQDGDVIAFPLPMCGWFFKF